MRTKYAHLSKDEFLKMLINPKLRLPDREMLEFCIERDYRTIEDFLLAKHEGPPGIPFYEARIADMQEELEALNEDPS